MTPPLLPRDLEFKISKAGIFCTAHSTKWLNVKNGEGSQIQIQICDIVTQANCESHKENIYVDNTSLQPGKVLFYEWEIFWTERNASLSFVFLSFFLLSFCLFVFLSFCLLIERYASLSNLSVAFAGGGRRSKGKVGY